MVRSSKQECVIKKATNTTKKVMPHAEFMQRVRKSFYFGCDLYDQGDEHLEMSKPLAEYASELFSDSHRGHTLNRLSCVGVSRVQTATPAALIMALIYLDRLNVTDPAYVRRITPQELFIVSMMISTKFYVGLDEEFYLSDWAQDGNVCEERLKQLELEFLCAINWNIYISNNEFFEKLTNIEETLARREGLKRGWLTYNELMQMLPSFTLAKFLLNNITIMAVSYAASVITIAGAFFFASQIPGTSLNQISICKLTKQQQQQQQRNLVISKYKMNASVMLTDTLGNEYNHLTSWILNTENELIKLEHQYREEALQLAIRERQNEISTESRLTLPQQQLMAKLNVKQKCAKSDKEQQQCQWFAYKDQYSDQLYNQYKQSSSTTDTDTDSTARTRLIFEKSNNIFNNNIHNCPNTTTLWHFLQDICSQSTYIRIPLLWIKLCESKFNSRLNQPNKQNYFYLTILSRFYKIF